MQPTYRAIFTEMLMAQVAAVETLADVTARCALLVGQECQALATLAMATERAAVDAGSKRPGDGPRIARPSPPSPVNLCRGLAGLPRFSMMSFLSHYDALRG